MSTCLHKRLKWSYFLPKLVVTSIDFEAENLLTIDFGPKTLLTTELRHDKTNKMSVRPAKTQISLGMCLVWSEPSLCAQWVAKDPSFLLADSEVFAWRTVILLVLSWGGSTDVRDTALSPSCITSHVFLSCLIWGRNRAPFPMPKSMFPNCC